MLDLRCLDITMHMEIKRVHDIFMNNHEAKMWKSELRSTSSLRIIGGGKGEKLGSSESLGGIKEEGETRKGRVNQFRLTSQHEHSPIHTNTPIPSHPHAQSSLPPSLSPHIAAALAKEGWTSQ